MFFRDIPLAWLQLTHSKAKFFAAVTGVVVAVLLMWMQLGFLDALYRSATSVTNHLTGDLVLISPHTKEFARPESFPRRLLGRALGHPDVVAVHPFYEATGKWQNPWNGEKRPILVFGMPPDEPLFDAKGLAEGWSKTNVADAGLFDVVCRPSLGNVGKHFNAGETVTAEINNRRVTVVGTVRIGVGFQADGNFVTTDANFLRLFPDRQANAIDVGVIELRPGADRLAVQMALRQAYGRELKVQTPQELIAAEYKFLQDNAPIGFVFTMGVVVGCFIGFAIVYQVLFTDISSHLPQYATLKAMGYSDGYLVRTVLQAALILAFCGYIPGTILAAGLYEIGKRATMLPMDLSFVRGTQVFGLSLAMCILSGLVAVRRLRSADPAEIF
ncbi:MAG: ABC transporter permease DevC [Planctomycetaceae bacterium]|nr:ABC transporter permease DevC [Planctomycetaceae bacterium]